MDFGYSGGGGHAGFFTSEGRRSGQNSFGGSQHQFFQPVDSSEQLFFDPNFSSRGLRSGNNAESEQGQGDSDPSSHLYSRTYMVSNDMMPLLQTSEASNHLERLRFQTKSQISLNIEKNNNSITIVGESESNNISIRALGDFLDTVWTKGDTLDANIELPLTMDQHNLMKDEVIEDIQRNSSARLGLMSGVNPTVMIRGTPSQIFRAQTILPEGFLKAFDDISNLTETKGPSPTLYAPPPAGSWGSEPQGGGFIQRNMPVAAEFVSRLLANGAEQLAMVQHQSGARVSPVPGPNGTHILTISGSSQSVLACEQLLLKLNSSFGASQQMSFHPMSMNGQLPFMYPPHPQQFRPRQKAPRRDEQMGYGSGGHGYSFPGMYSPFPGHQQPPSQYSRTIRVMEDKVGLVIGKGGSTIRHIQDQSGARVVVAPQHSLGHPSLIPAFEKEIILSGSQSQVEHAERLIRSHLSSSNETNTSESVEVPNEYVGLLIGSNGATVRKLEIETGARLEIPKINEGDESPRVVVIKGASEQVAHCKARVLGILRSVMAPSPGSNQITRSISFPNSRIGLIIGKNGAIVKQLQDRTGCTIRIPKEIPENSETREITLVGSADALADLEATLMRIIEAVPAPGFLHDIIDTPRSVSGIHQVAPDKVGLIIGKNGGTIHQIQMDSNCRISIRDDGLHDADPSSAPTRQIEIAGYDDAAVAQCIRLIDETIAKAETKVSQGEQTLKMLVPEKKVGLIIGRNGGTIKHISYVTRTVIDIPKEASGDEDAFREITITGTEAGLNHCQHLIEQICSSADVPPHPIGVSALPPPHALHSHHASHPSPHRPPHHTSHPPHGSSRQYPYYPSHGQQMMFPYPSMQQHPYGGFFPHFNTSQQETPNTSYSEFPPQPSENSQTVSLQVPGDKMGLIIGKSGGTIKQLQEETGATIHAPRLGPSFADPLLPRTLTISGPPLAVSSCVSRIQRMIESGPKQVHPSPMPSPHLRGGEGHFSSHPHPAPDVSSMMQQLSVNPDQSSFLGPVSHHSPTIPYPSESSYRGKLLPSNPQGPQTRTHHHAVRERPSATPTAPPVELDFSSSTAFPLPGDSLNVVSQKKMADSPDRLRASAPPPSFAGFSFAETVKKKAA